MNRAQRVLLAEIAQRPASPEGWIDVSDMPVRDADLFAIVWDLAIEARFSGQKSFALLTDAGKRMAAEALPDRPKVMP